jgi:ribosome maturation factor RimP
MGRLRFVGDLCEVADDLIVIEVDGEQYDLPFSGMKSARIEPTY